MIAQLFAVIRREDDQRVVPQTLALQEVEQAPELIVDFARKNAAIYNDGGYMTDAFGKGATDSAPLARILPAVTDELWKRGYSNEDLAKIFGGHPDTLYRREPDEDYLNGDIPQFVPVADFER